MAADPSPELLEARRQLAELRVENDRLRSLLGLDERPVASHTQSWEPTLFASAPTLLEVDDTSPPDQKIALFRLLFVGRRDVYAHDLGVLVAPPGTGKTVMASAIICPPSPLRPL